MRIPNKFNGYSRDGIRLYNDPVTAATVAAGLSGAGTVAGLGTTATALGAAGALEGGILAGTTLAGSSLGLEAGAGALSSMFGGAGGAASLLSAPTTAALSPEIAANLAAANAPAGLAPQVAQNALGYQGFGAPVAPATGIPSLTPGIEIPPVSPATTMQSMVNTTPYDVSQFGVQPPTPDVVSEISSELPTNSNAPGYQVDSSGPAKIGSQDTQFELGKNMTGDTFGDVKRLISNPNWANIKDFANQNPYTAAAGAYGLYKAIQPKPLQPKTMAQYQRPYNNTLRVNPNVDYYKPYSGGSTAERNYFTGGLEAQPIQRVAADGGLMSLNSYAVGGPIETMSAENAVGQNMGYPQADLQTAMYSNPMVQRPIASNVINQGVDTNVDPYTGEERMAGGGMAGGGEAGGYKYDYNPKTMQFTQLSEPKPERAGPITQAMGMNGLNSTNYRRQEPQKPFTPVTTGGIATPTGQVAQAVPMQQAQPIQEQTYPAYQTPEQQLGLTGFYGYMDQQLANMQGAQGMAGGGMATLGGYSDGGRLLRGPGDGVSDSIPASIGDRQPARLADGEFVVPARIVSEIGNGSTEAGARKLYAMMDRVQGARKKSVGKGNVAVNSKADRLLPA